MQPKVLHKGNKSHVGERKRLAELNIYLIQEKQNRENKKQKQINTIENVQ